MKERPQWQVGEKMEEKSFVVGMPDAFTPPTLYFKAWGRHPSGNFPSKSQDNSQLAVTYW
jgi:hypothetical protein